MEDDLSVVTHTTSMQVFCDTMFPHQSMRPCVVTVLPFLFWFEDERLQMFIGEAPGPISDTVALLCYRVITFKGADQL